MARNARGSRPSVVRASAPCAVRRLRDVDDRTQVHREQAVDVLIGLGHPELGSDILVDGDLLGVELDRRASLLVRPVPGCLGSAERNVDVRAGGLRVDVDDAACSSFTHRFAIAMLVVNTAAERPKRTLFARSIASSSVP